MPSYLPKPKLLVYISGIVEIALGMALFIPKTFSFAVYGIILMLLAFLPVHIYMFLNKKAGLGLPKWLLAIRILIQFLLMYWAWIYLAEY